MKEKKNKLLHFSFEDEREKIQVSKIKREKTINEKPEKRPSDGAIQLNNHVGGKTESIILKSFPLFFLSSAFFSFSYVPVGGFFPLLSGRRRWWRCQATKANPTGISGGGVRILFTMCTRANLTQPPKPPVSLLFHPRHPLFFPPARVYESLLWNTED